MNVCMVSSEAVPFCKTGGLADVVGALSQALAKDKHDVRILLPLYGGIARDGMEDTGLSATIKVAGNEEKVGFLMKKVGLVPYYFVSHPSFSTRNGVYGDTSFAPYTDNISRFTILDKAVFALCKALDWKPDVLHCHDWTCGFVPYLLSTNKDPFFQNTKSVVTIHNLAYQGDFSRLDFLASDIDGDDRLFVGHGSEKRCNMLKSGLEFADAITTVSPTYANEIKEQEGGCGLDGLLRSRSANLTGILNGIDYEEWDSSTDPNLDCHFSTRSLTGKAKMKTKIQKEFGLEQKDDIPLIAMISRIADQKGFRELLDGEPCALERILRDQRLQMVVIGTGDKDMERKLQELAKRYDNLSVNILFDNKAAHRLEAGADYFLMPSRFEPCGLNQMYSLHYGTLPIAHKTGGLADSIIDADENPEVGDGFLYDAQSGEEIEKTVKRALSHYPDLKAMRLRGMHADFTWEKSARSYFRIYGLQ